MIKIAVYSLC